jgi:hypothetical protein
MWELEERPLVGLEVYAEREPETGKGLQTIRMEYLNPYVHIAVRLRPIAFAAMGCVRNVRVRIQVENWRLHGSRCDRTSFGQRCGSSP